MFQARRVLTAVFLLPLAVLFSGCEKQPELTPRQEEENNIRETVFRRLIETNRPAMLYKPSVIYLTVEGKEDPDRSFMGRFQDHDPPAKPGSEHPGTAAARSGTGRQKIHFTIDSIRWVSDTEVEVRARTDQDGGLTTGVYTLEKQNGEWAVTMEHTTAYL